jgi:hypothetical protein
METLRKLHGVRLDLTGPSIDDVELALRETAARRDAIIRESQFNAYHDNPEYTKTVLLIEAMRLFLREIAPKRSRRRRVAESQDTPSCNDLDAELIRAVEEEIDTLDQAELAEAEGADTMSGITKESKNTVKATLARQVAALREKVETARKAGKVTEKQSRTRFATLLEAELEQAEVLLAAKGLGDDLQKMAENLASMQVQDLMPLVDRMKEEFDGGKADGFNKAVQQVLQAALEAVKQAKEGIDNEVLRLQGENPGNDMAGFGGDAAAPAAGPAGGDMGGAPAAPMGDMAGGMGGGMGGDVMSNGQIDFPVHPDDGFGGADAGAGPEEEPLGRAKKESRRPKGRMVRENGVTRGGMDASSRTAHLTLVDDLHMEGFDHTAANWIADIMTHDRVTKAEAVERYFTERAAGRSGMMESRTTVKKKFAETVDPKAPRKIDLDLPPEVNAAIDDLEYYVRTRRLPVREARKRAIAKHRRLAEAATRNGDLMVSAKAVAQALDSHLAENATRLGRIASLNGLTMPAPLLQAVRQVGLSETEFRDAVTGYLSEARGKVAEARYGEIVAKLAETTERNPAGVATWVASLIERRTITEVARVETYQSFTRKLLDEARGKSVRAEDLLGRLKGAEQDVAVISALHEAIAADGMAAAYHKGAFTSYATVAERLRRVQGDAARHVEGILGRASEVIEEHRSQHADLDTFGIDLLGQLDERYRGVRPEFELALGEHLKAAK